MTNEEKKTSIIHIDMDAFYTSVEARDNPSYQKKPLIVGGTSNRGVVSSASYEARAFGVRSAMPIVQAKKLCPQGIYINPHMEKYKKDSQSIMNIMHHYTPLVEPVSLDEAYLDVKGSEKLFGNAEIIGKEIQQKIKEQTQLTCSVGVAPNKFLAKIASEINKPNGFCLIQWHERQEVLSYLPIEAIGGIGKKTASILRNLGLKTINDLQKTSLENLKSCLGNQAYHFLKLANGEDDRQVTPPQSQLSIGKETTFMTDLYQKTEMYAHLLKLSDEVGIRLRKKERLAKTICLKVKFSDFTLMTRNITIDTPTNITKEIYHHVKELLEKIPQTQKKGIRLLGISLQQLQKEGQQQLLLFYDEESEKEKQIDHVMDTIRYKYGKKSIMHGSNTSKTK